VRLRDHSSLHREVALKEIRERYANEIQPRSRFLLEAGITGGLEHPGIVPVYGLGHHPDGIEMLRLTGRGRMPSAPSSAIKPERGSKLSSRLGRICSNPPAP
jgi:hypothetical protein